MSISHDMGLSAFGCRRWLTVLTLILLAIAACAAPMTDPTYDVPRLNGIVIDGNAADWGDRGYRVSAMPTHYRYTLPVEDFDPSFRVGWHAEGMLILAEVRDDVVVESDDIANLWMQDCIEMFVSAAPGSPEYYQVDVNTGADPKYPMVRSHFYDYRKSKDTLPTLSATFAVRKTKQGYLVEALLPWKNFQTTPKLGDEVGMQLCFYDADATGEAWFRHMWYGRGHAFENPRWMQRLRLSEQTSTPVTAVTDYRYNQEDDTTYLAVYGVPALIGTPVSFVRHGEAVLTQTFESDGGRAFTRFAIPKPSGSTPYDEVRIAQGDLLRTQPLNGPMAFTARVVLPDGTPVANALISAPPCYIPNYTLPAVSNEDGYFTFYTPFMPGEHYTFVRGGKYTTQGYGFLINVSTKGDVTGPSVITLVPGAEIAGTLLDDNTGQPLAGVTIALGGCQQATQTDAHGKFLFEGMPEGEYRLTVQDKRYATAVHSCQVPSGKRTEITMRTKPGAVLRGKVADEKGNPIANVFVAPNHFESILQQAHTNAQGEYELFGFDPDAVIPQFHASLEGYESGYGMNQVFPAGTRELVYHFTLQSIKEKVRTITGRVERPDGTPVAGAPVLYGWDNYYYRAKKTTTDAHGFYELVDVDDTKNLVVVQADGFAPVAKFVDEKVSAIIDFTLQPPHALTGIVTDDTGKPLEGVRISAGMPEDAESKQLRHQDFTFELANEAISDSTGAFHFRNLPAGQVVLTGYKQGHVHLRGVTVPVDQSVKIALARQAYIFGTAVDAETGKPLSQVKVYLEHPNDLSAEERKRNYFAACYEGMTLTTNEGRFSAPAGYPGDPMRVVVEAPGYSRQVMQHVTMALSDPDGAQAKANTFRLQPGRPFEITVVDADGKPLDGVALVLTNSGSINWGANGYQHDGHDNIIQLRTDAQGKARTDTLTLTNPTLAVSRPGYGRTAISGFETTKPLTVTLEKGASISGTVPWTGEKRPTFKVSLNRDRQEFFPPFQNNPFADGNFTFPDLAPGKYVVTVYAGEYEGIRQFPVTVQAGESLVVDWDKRGENELEGRVTLRGKPVEGVQVRVSRLDYSRGKAHYAMERTDAEGRYRFAIPEPGEYRVMIQQGQRNNRGINDIQRVTVKRGSNRVDINYTNVVSGRVIDQATGKPVANAPIRAYLRQQGTLYRAEDSWSNQRQQPSWVSLGFDEIATRTDAEGRYTCDALRAGEWILTVRPAGIGYEIPSMPFRLKEHQTITDLALTVPAGGTADVKAIDAATGQPVENALMVCVNANGYIIQPLQQNADTAPWDHGYNDYAQPAPGVLRFSNLAPGRYTVYLAEGYDKMSGGNGYVKSGVIFEVKAGETVTPTLALKKGGTLMFRLPDGTKLAGDDSLIVGYRVTKGGKPVLADAFGPSWGSSLGFYRDHINGTVTLPTGTYRLQAVLRIDDRYVGKLHAPGVLWTVSKTITVTAGKETVIDIPWTKAMADTP